VRPDNPGPFGLLLMMIGLILAGGVVWTGCGTGIWSGSITTLLIGLALMAFGYSFFKRGRRRPRG
jgi:hypothetical protein